MPLSGFLDMVSCRAIFDKGLRHLQMLVPKRGFWLQSPVDADGVLCFVLMLFAS